MNKYSIPPDEQETTINISRYKQECDIWTSDTTMMTKLDKLCEISPEYYKLVDVGTVEGQTVDKVYVLSDKTLISFRRKHVELSEDQKQKRSERMKDMRDSK